MRSWSCFFWPRRPWRRLALAPERIFDVRIVQMTGKFGRHRHRVGPVAFGKLARVTVSLGDKSRPAQSSQITPGEEAQLQGERGQLVAQVAEAKGKIAEIQLQIIQVDEDSLRYGRLGSSARGVPPGSMKPVLLA